MKKFICGSLIAALIMSVVGTIFIVIGALCGGLNQARHVVFNNVGSFFHHVEWNADFDMPCDYVVNGEVSFNPDQTVHMGSYCNLEEFTKDSVDSIVFFNAAGSVDVVESENTYYGVDGSCEGGFQFYVEDDVLYLLAVSSHPGDALTVYIPTGCDLDAANLSVAAGEMTTEVAIKADETEVELGAGSMTIYDVNSEKLTVSVGAGSVDVYNSTIKDGKFDVAAGEMSYQGTIAGDVEGSCAAGSIIINVNADEDDFDYEISAAMGGITVGTHYIAGIGADQDLDNDADQCMKLDTAMGYITVSFE